MCEGRLVRGRLVGEGELIRKVVLLHTVEAGAVKEGCGFLSSRCVPSSRVPSRCLLSRWVFIEVDFELWYQGGCGFPQVVWSGFALYPGVARSASGDSGKVWR